MIKTHIGQQKKAWPQKILPRRLLPDSSNRLEEQQLQKKRVVVLLLSIHWVSGLGAGFWLAVYIGSVQLGFSNTLNSLTLHSVGSVLAMDKIKTLRLREEMRAAVKHSAQATFDSLPDVPQKDSAKTAKSEQENRQQ